MDELFPNRDVKAMNENLRRQGAPFGLYFIERVRLSNSRLALEAGEFARETGRFDLFHRAVFAAYFAEGQDIGDHSVILKIAAKCGLDVALLSDALKQGRYIHRLASNQLKAQQLGIRSVPTFLINGQERIVGAQAIERFRESLRTIARESES